MAGYTGFNKGFSIEDTVASMQKTLSWLMNNLDSMNVTSLNTNITQISSENGETVIDGPLILKYDSAKRLRQREGLDISTGEFVYEMYDPTGKKTVYIDSDGYEVLDGKFSLTQNGYTLITAFKDSNGGVLNVYDNYGNLNVKLGSEGSGGSNMGGTLLLYADAPQFADPKQYMRIGLAIDAATQCGIISLRNGSNIRRVQLEGDGGIFLFDEAGTQKGYLDALGGYLNNKDIITSGTSTDTYYYAGHNHGIPSGTKLMVEGGGTVTWVESGGFSHSHTV